METTEVHLELEIPLETSETEVPIEINQESEIDDPLTTGGKVIVGTAKVVGKILGGIYDVIKPEGEVDESQE